MDYADHGPCYTKNSGRHRGSVPEFPVTSAVAKGKDRASGVFPSWAEASHLILGTSGAVSKKFRDHDKAIEFVRTSKPWSNPESPSRLRKT
jgi:hypothetical protein